VIPELSRFRLIWDCLILALVFVSCTAIPYQIAFSHGGQNTNLGVLYVIDAIFIVDIAFNFFTSYRSRGVEIFEPGLTVRRYLRAEFLIDAVANLPVLILPLLASDQFVFGLSLVAFFRLPQLMRIARLFVILKRWEAFSWIADGYLRIVKFLGFVALLVHWIACAWFVAAMITGFSQDSWVVRTGIEALDPADQYIRSLYWTIATITTVGYGDITPGHTAEYAVALIVMITGASLYAFLIGSVASLLSNLNASQNRHKKRVMVVTQYLHDRHAPRQLSDRVRSYYDYVWERDRGLNDAALLNDLPGPLRLDIMLHITRNILHDAPLFQHCSDPLRDALLMALELQIYPPDSYIVRKGEPGKQVFFVTDGSMEIIFGEDQRVYGEFGPGDYFGHLSMVLGETRTASIRTLTYCDVYVLGQEKFRKLRDDFSEFSEVLKLLSVEKTEKVSKMLIDGLVL
jgi:hypothetical protein